jgi:Replication-relaxation
MRFKIDRANAKPKPIQLSNRDRAILRDVNDYGILSTEQVFRLRFPSIHRARKRLRLLWRHRFVTRNVRPMRRGEGSSPYLYSLAHKGRRLLAGDEPVADSTHRVRPIGTSEHTLRLNDFRIALSLNCRGSIGLMLKDWKQGRTVRFDPAVRNGSLTVRVPIVPDGFFTLQYGGKDFSYFLEIDRGTADLGRIRTKILAYLNLWHSGAASTKLGVRSFRLLYDTSSEKRLVNMLSMMQTLSQTTQRIGICVMTTFSRYSLSRPETLMEPIWQSIDHSGNFVRTCPFPGSIPSTLPIAPGKPPVCEPEA